MIFLLLFLEFFKDRSVRHRRRTGDPALSQTDFAAVSVVHAE